MTVFLRARSPSRADLLLNAFFVAAEYALVTARRTRLDELAQRGQPPARAIVLRIIDEPAALHRGDAARRHASPRSRIGASASRSLAHALRPGASRRCSPSSLAFLILTFLHVVIGELVPKGDRARALRRRPRSWSRAPGARVLRRCLRR